MGELWVDHISFSQLSTASECPYAYYLQKIIGVETIPNAFAEAGSLAHQLLSEWARGELSEKDLPVQWVVRFPKEVTAEFPHFLVSKGYDVKLFESVLGYFANFSGFPGYEIVDSEKRFTSMISGECFEGVIDLILRDKATGKFMIVDFKSCSLASFRKNQDQMYRQLLLYSKYCNDLFGCPPSKLRFELIKENTFDERDYSPEDYIGARIWAETVIEEMKTKEMTDWFEVKPDYFRCTNLCNCRNDCLCGKAEYYRRKEESNGTKNVSSVA